MIRSHSGSPQVLSRRSAMGNRTVNTLLMLVITIPLAGLSYRYVELPFLRLKKRYQAVPS